MSSTTNKTRKIIVTQALPYANASLHLGHILEAVQTDIWSRFQNKSGNECLFFCADDTHGTPVMLKAKELGISPEDLIKDVQRIMKRPISFMILILQIITQHIQMRIKNILKKFT